MVNAVRIERQLTPVLGQPRAALIASLAEGIAGTIMENPFGRALVAPDFFPAITVIYAGMLHSATEATTAQDIEEAGRASAVRTLEEMAQILIAVNAEDPNPPKSLGMAGMTLADLLGGLPRGPLVNQAPDGDLEA